MLSRLVKMLESLNLQDPDIKVARIGFSPDFTRIIVIGEPLGRGGCPMYWMTKLLVGILPNLEHAYKSGSCATCLDMGIIVFATNNSDGVVCEDPSQGFESRQDQRHVKREAMVESAGGQDCSESYNNPSNAGHLC